MNIVVDTNVLISGIFFGGYPERILKTIVAGKVSAFVTVEIIEEYIKVFDEMISRKNGHMDNRFLATLIYSMNIIEAVSSVCVSRDPDDDKFISCALDADADFIVSGDKDLLVLKNYENIKIVTAKLFCESCSI